MNIFTDVKPTKTFYGNVPRTTKEMLEHTNNVTNYYVGEIQVHFDNLMNIEDNRIHAFKQIEESIQFPNHSLFIGSYEEEWNLRKVLRRFLWHDRIHAKAMYRLGLRNWSSDIIKDPFYFQSNIEK